VTDSVGTIRYAELAIRLPAICGICGQQIDDMIYVVHGQIYCYEHLPIIVESEVRDALGLNDDVSLEVRLCD